MIEATGSASKNNDAGEIVSSISEIVSDMPPRVMQMRRNTNMPYLDTLVQEDWVS